MYSNDRKWISLMLTHLRSWPFRTLSFRFRWIWQNASTITRITIVTSLHFSNMMNKYKKGSRGSSSSSTKSTLHSGRSIINATLHDTWSEFYYVRDNNTEDESELPGDDRHLRPKKTFFILCSMTWCFVVIVGFFCFVVGCDVAFRHSDQ